MKKINESGYLKEYKKQSISSSNRQNLPDYYINNGSIYISKWDVFINDRSFYQKNCYPYIMDKKFSLDIDTIEDWEYAEFLLK